jgi:hypothetical protein
MSVQTTLFGSCGGRCFTLASFIQVSVSVRIPLTYLTSFSQTLSLNLEYQERMYKLNGE